MQNISNSDGNDSIKKLANDLRSRLEKSFNEQLDQEKILYLARSKNEQDRVRAAKIIGDSGNHDFTSLLKNLLKDLSPVVKLQAIHSVARFGNRDLWPFLIDQLSDDQFRSSARAAIESIGDPVMESLERAFYKSGPKQELLLAIIDLYGKIG